MNHILLDVRAVWNTMHQPPKKLIRWGWTCRVCGAKSRVSNNRWSDIRYLGIGHVRRNHPELIFVAPANLDILELRS